MRYDSSNNRLCQCWPLKLPIFYLNGAVILPDPFREMGLWGNDKSRRDSTVWPHLGLRETKQQLYSSEDN